MVSSRYPAFCVSAVARALPWCLFGHSNTRLSPDVSSQVSLSKVSNAEESQSEQQVNWKVSSAYLDLSRRVKLNDFADLTTSGFVSEYTEFQSNIVVVSTWKLLKTSTNHSIG